MRKRLGGGLGKKTETALGAHDVREDSLLKGGRTTGGTFLHQPVGPRGGLKEKKKEEKKGRVGEIALGWRFTVAKNRTTWGGGMTASIVKRNWHSKKKTGKGGTNERGPTRFSGYVREPRPAQKTRGGWKLTGTSWD